MIAHLIRAAERFNDRMGNQFGAAGLPIFPFVDDPDPDGLVRGSAGFVLASHPTLLQDIFTRS